MQLCYGGNSPGRVEGEEGRNLNVVLTDLRGDQTHVTVGREFGPDPAWHAAQ